MKPNPKLFEKWQEEAYAEWLIEEREGKANAIVSLSTDVKEQKYLGKWARDTRIPEMLKEIKELDDEIKRFSEEPEEEPES